MQSVLFIECVMCKAVPCVVSLSPVSASLYPAPCIRSLDLFSGGEARIQCAVIKFHTAGALPIPDTWVLLVLVVGMLRIAQALTLDLLSSLAHQGCLHA